MPDLKNPYTGFQRSRRNLIKVGAIGASSLFASLTNTRPAAAQNSQSNNDNQNNDNQNNDDNGHKKCFLKGTNIRTADGDRKIEDLAVGDLLPTVFGGICPIQWIGYYPYKKSDQAKPWVKDVLPVRVARSALGPGVPHADLCVTKAHALFIDGVLVPVGSLINGTTVTLYDAYGLDELEFFHVKLEHHDVIYAEGAPCETLLDVDENAVNFADYLRKYGPSTTQEAPCAPLLSFNGGRSEMKSRFRSAISPWIDRRQKLDIVRDKLEERGIALLRQSELIS
jgi:hypothetical protein